MTQHQHDHQAKDDQQRREQGADKRPAERRQEVVGAQRQLDDNQDDLGRPATSTSDTSNDLGRKR